MKVTRMLGTVKPPLTLDDLKPGEPFRFCGLLSGPLYMRVITFLVGPTLVTNVCLDTGRLDYSGLASHVVRVEAEVVEK